MADEIWILEQEHNARLAKQAALLSICDGCGEIIYGPVFSTEAGENLCKECREETT